jgi:hypothetical protein
MKKIISVLIIACCAQSVFARSIDDIFSGLTEEQRAALAGDGINITTEDPSRPALALQPSAGVNIAQTVLAEKPLILFESAMLVKPAPANALLAVYNALSQVNKLAGRLYHSATRDEWIPMFKEATRVKSEKDTGKVSDPPLASSIPQSDTFYVRVNDSNFGNCYYRGVLENRGSSMTFTLDNYKTIRYIFFSVMKENDFNCKLYFEQMDEGLLIYTAAGMTVPSFASSMINVSSAMRKRIEVIQGWIIDGL